MVLSSNFTPRPPPIIQCRKFVVPVKVCLHAAGYVAVPALEQRCSGQKSQVPAGIITNEQNHGERCKFVPKNA